VSSRQGRAPQCPFCGAELGRPSEIAVDAIEKGQGGTCRCGAVFLVDATGKNVGLLMAQALGMTAEALSKSVSELVPDEDYEDAILSYDWRTHRSSGVSTGYMDGYGRLYIIRPKKKKTG
jgi:hypothetical protein